MRRIALLFLCLASFASPANAQVARRVYSVDDLTFQAALASAPKSARRETAWMDMNVVFVNDGGQLVAKQGTNWPIGQIVTLRQRTYTLLYIDGNGAPVWLIAFTSTPGRVGTGFDPYSESMFVTWTPEGEVIYGTDTYSQEIEDYELFWPIDVLTGH